MNIGDAVRQTEQREGGMPSWWLRRVFVAKRASGLLFLKRGGEMDARWAGRHCRRITTQLFAEPKEALGLNANFTVNRLLPKISVSPYKNVLSMKSYRGFAVAETSSGKSVWPAARIGLPLLMPSFARKSLQRPPAASTMAMAARQSHELMCGS